MPSNSQSHAKRKEGRFPGRPRPDGRPPLSKEDILTAAAQLFATHGYDGTSIRDICSVLNSTPSSIFHRFPTKKDIAEEVYRRGSEPYLEMYDRLSATGLSIDTQLYLLLYMESRASAEDDPVVRAIFGMSELKRSEFEKITHIRKDAEQRRREMISEGIASGIFVAIDPSVVAALLIYAPEAGYFTTLDTGSADHQARNFARLILRGLLIDQNRLSEIEKDAHAIKISFRNCKFT
ncbi:TetR/AcrR family transcriptional regulator [Sphingosinicella xenopeptidilytica]|uniref:TetR/AcrR family transcriptional regulator n=1 Tax=Sphingosinicella xenopeptidilytica TaxID=364098 RepID=A0ABW3C770_SPHXN